MLSPRGTPLRTFMLVLAPVLAVTAIGAIAAFAEPARKPTERSVAGFEPTAGENLANQIRRKLSAQGYSDVEIQPASYLVSAKDKEGNSFLILIAPDSTTILAMEKSAMDNQADPTGPSTAEAPDRNDSTNKDKPIFQ